MTADGSFDSSASQILTENSGKVIVEAGVYDIGSALAAQKGGADRIELCSDLAGGGVTPSEGMIRKAREVLDIGLYVMIRPRPYDFCYNDLEFDVMASDIAAAKRLGADGVVLGALHPDGTVDADRIDRLIRIARPMEVTFHRAFDVSRNLDESLQTLISLGVDRVLTTGGQNHSTTAVPVLKRLVQQAGEQIRILVGRIDEQTVSDVIASTGAREIHIGGRSLRESRMAYRVPHIRMGMMDNSDYAWPATSAEHIRRMVDAAKGSVAE